MCVTHHSSTSNRVKSLSTYELNTIENLHDGLILTVNHKYLKFPNIPVLRTSQNRGCIPRSPTFGILKPLDTANAKVNDIALTKLEKLSEKDAEY